MMKNYSGSFGAMTTKRRTFLKALGAATGAAAIGTQSVTAQPPINIPDRTEFHTPIQLLSNDALAEALDQFAGATQQISLETIGTSNEGRPIFLASIGNGDCDVMAIAEQHGNEMFLAEGCLDVLQTLAEGGHSELLGKSVDTILENVTLHVVPRVNPDGVNARHRYNVDPDAPIDDPDDTVFGAETGVFANEEAEGIGWDINRYHWYDWTESDLYQNFPDEYPENPVTEIRHLLEAVQDIDPDWIIDYHRTEARVQDDWNIVTTSIFWPIAEGVPQEAQELSQQICRTIYDQLDPSELRHVTQYPGGDYPGIARNAHGLAGRGSVLFEMLEGTVEDREGRIQQVYESLLVTLQATADGSLYDVDPTLAEEIPDTWDFDEPGAEYTMQI